MGVASLDLNLLVALDALLQERSVTRAAQRLGLSQPTLSASLARLRRHFDDQLLHRAGNSYQLTPLAIDLARRTSGALDEVTKIFATSKTADLTSSTREFVIICSDYTAAVIGTRLSALLAREAPSVRLHLRQSNPSRFANAEDRMRAVDGVLMPHGFIGGVPYTDLYTDRWVCLVADDNPLVGERLTVEDLSRLPWAVHGETYSATAVRALAQQGVRVQVQCAVDNFLSLPFLVPGTHRVAVVQQRLVGLYGRLPGVRVLPCPFDAGTIIEAFWWHPDFERDAEHAWLREKIAELSGSFDRDKAVPV